MCCVDLAEFVGTPAGELLDLQLNEMYDFVMSPTKLDFTGFSCWYAGMSACSSDSYRLENDLLGVSDLPAGDATWRKELARERVTFWEMLPLTLLFWQSGVG
jgi:hypothetical protein